ncbi:TlpA family protein disulfide reductase [Acidimangrovimonas pyrenivorans]|uniref:TlpA family protein disulfide reductase n=1 Tax=Acidimangrovimonas pyrenivorans TaxID=2030798 RepID=A0ABV7AGA4_9RHOB
MHLVRTAVLYAALALGANAALAESVPDMAALSALRAGDMKKLSFHQEPKALPDTPIYDAEGGEHSLAEYRGKYVVLNFWATWCAPCRKEMPTLDRLQADLGGAKFQVLPVATLRNSVPAVKRFFAEDKIANLPVMLDPHGALAHQIGVMGLPVTLILDPEGREIGRLIGDADWDSDSAKAIVRALTAAE